MTQQSSLSKGQQQYITELEKAIARIVEIAAFLQRDGGLAPTPEVDELLDAIAAAKTLLDHN